MKKNYSYLLFLLFNSFLGFSCFSQNVTVVKGVIRDKQTKEAVPFASVMFVSSTVGTNSSFEGEYRLTSTVPTHNKLKFSFVGYKTLIVPVQPGKEQVIDIQLEQEATQLKEVSVKANKIKYRNKNNEAVDLINKVIDNKSRNQPSNYDFYEYEKYEKIQFALSNVSEKFKDKAAFKDFKFIFEGVDSTKFQGKPVLPVYIKESLTDVYFRKDPKKEKQIVKADKMVSFEGYVNNDGVDNYLKNMYQHIDIYENDIMLLTNQFLSPIAQNAPLFYKFFILDTLVVEQQKLINMGFVPRNPNDFLFQGNLYITLDSAYAVKKLAMSVNNKINLNWVKDLKITQDFEKDEAGHYALVKDDFMSDFGVGRSSMGIFGQKTVSYKNIRINEPRSRIYYEGLDVEVKADAKVQTDDFWEASRHDALTGPEMGVYAKIDSVKKNKSFRRILNIATPFMIGYRGFGPIEIGPVNTFVSFNPIEGFRLRFGGRTTPQFSKKVMFDTYSAYGFKDQAWKYYLGVTYSFTNKTIFDFPVKSLKVSYQKDTKIAGQNLQEDNFFLSFKRGSNDNWTYNDIFNVEYLNEFHNHFSFLLGYKYLTQYPAGTLNFSFDDYNDKTKALGHLTTSEFTANVRWAPKEQFYQAKLSRIPIYNRYPVLSLTYALGVKDVFNGEYNYHNISFSAFKRFYLSQIGYTNILLEGGQLIGTVPFPLLTIHRANQSYAFQYRSYNLMNFLEFVSDRYAAVTVDHFFNGFFFNKIPLMKKLKWREVASLKLLYGDLREENNPAYNKNILQFPQLADGTPIMHTFENKPYVEGSVGVANVFKFLRVDLVKRFNYLDHPNISGLGVRASFKFDF